MGGRRGGHRRSLGAAAACEAHGAGTPGGRECEGPLEEGPAGRTLQGRSRSGWALLQAADIEFLPAHFLLEAATRIAIALDHPASDCLYLALAVDRDCRWVTADERLLRKLGEGHRRTWRARVISLRQAAAEVDPPSRTE